MKTESVKYKGIQDGSDSLQYQIQDLEKIINQLDAKIDQKR